MRRQTGLLTETQRELQRCLHQLCERTHTPVRREVHMLLTLSGSNGCLAVGLHALVICHMIYFFSITLVFRVLHLNTFSLSVNWLSFVTHILPVRPLPPLCISSHVSNYAVKWAGGTVRLRVCRFSVAPFLITLLFQRAGVSLCSLHPVSSLNVTFLAQPLHYGSLFVGRGHCLLIQTKACYYLPPLPKTQLTVGG